MKLPDWFHFDICKQFLPYIQKVRVACLVISRDEVRFSINNIFKKNLKYHHLPKSIAIQSKQKIQTSQQMVRNNKDHQQTAADKSY